MTSKSSNTNSGNNSTSYYSSSRSTDFRSLRRCLEWRYNIESVAPDTNRETLSTHTLQTNATASTPTMLRVSSKVSRAIEDMKTSAEAQNLLDVANNIRAERAAELAVLEQLLEQCKEEIQMLESKAVTARGRVADTDRGIAAMRKLMLERGLLDKDAALPD